MTCSLVNAGMVRWVVPLFLQDRPDNGGCMEDCPVKQFDLILGGKDCEE
jgi:hypothetical protein